MPIMTDQTPEGSDAANEAVGRADISRIMNMIPHRYPFLLVDAVEEIRKGHSAVGIKNVTINEPFFQGHFPGAPIMPGVLIVEALAQTAAVMVVDTLGREGEDLLVYFMTVDKCRFRNRVVPGDRLELHVRVIRGRGKIWKFWGEGRVNGQIAAECEFSAMIVAPDDRAREPAARG
jgi:3-hydroxyacyl-[acyl-carrier-protein] dehydratase